MDYIKPAQHILLIVSLFCSPAALNGQKTDPYHADEGGFGYLFEKNKDFSLWWCEGAYKIMRNTRAPSRKKNAIELWSAKNEYEPFQLILFPGKKIDSLKITAGELISESGIIGEDNITVRNVEYVKITRPTDSYAYAGDWPDPLPEAKHPVTAYTGENTVFWITVHVPDSIAAGIYTGSIIISGQGLIQEVPLKLNIWDFCLPEKTSLRSGFGLSVDKIAAYHNLTDEKEIRETFDLYMQAFRDYRIAPYDPFYLYPVRVTISGTEWEGGIYDFNNSFNGDYSLMIEDSDPQSSPVAGYKTNINIDPGKKYDLRWNIKSDRTDHQYCVLFEGYDAEGGKMVFENRMEVFNCDSIWSSQLFTIGPFSDKVSSLKLMFFPVFRTAAGENTGRIWLDNVILTDTGDKTNLIKQGDFEIDTTNIGLDIDFSDFDRAGERYLDEFGFNSFRLYLKGTGSGTYFSREEWIFEYFMKGSPAYDKLMNLYLSSVQDHLEEKGWLGKEYIYWFDEPAKKDYPFVREGMETIKRSAPKLTTFLTENDPGPEITDVTDITCTIFHRVDPVRAKELTAGGHEYWSYLCTAPKAPWVSEFIDHDAVNMRIWLWMTYSYRLNGILIWSTNYWNSYSASPEGYLQNPWSEPASFVQGYGWPYGKQSLWGNGDGRLFYPPNRHPGSDKTKYTEGPVPSLRLEFLRQGIEDYEYLTLLEMMKNSITGRNSKIVKEADELLRIQGKLFNSGKDYTKNPGDILEYRKKVARMIIKIKNK